MAKLALEVSSHRILPQKFDLFHFLAYPSYLYNKLNNLAGDKVHIHQPAAYAASAKELTPG